MFDNLVESSSHKDDLARKGSFFIGTALVYFVLFVALGIGSIYLYDAQLSNENLELTTLVAPVPIPPQPQQDQPKEQPKPQKTDQQVATRTELVARVDQPTVVPKTVETKASNIPPIPKGQQVALGRSNVDVAPTGPSGPVGVGSGGGGSTGPVKTEALGEAPPEPEPKPKPKPAVVSGGVLNGKAISKPTPTYPAIAKAARQQGTVTVQILVDESGKVVSATAINGPPLLRQAAVQGAFQTRFSPTLLSGQPVKVSGTITFNFTLQ
jgi:protein TonB